MSDQQVLIIESGGSHWDMAFVPLHSHDKESVEVQRLQGFNPNSHTLQDLTSRLETLVKNGSSNFKKVVFYCAGLQDVHKAEIAVCFNQSLSFETLELNNDLVAIGHAAAPHEKTHITILGTGSNLAYWSGQKIDYTVAALGYLIGDEGSSKHITKEVVKRYFRKQYGKPLMDILDGIIHMNYEDFVIQVYQKNQWSTLLHGWMSDFQPIWDHDEIKETSQTCIDTYFNQVILPEQPERLIMTGGIARSYKDYICTSWRDHHQMNIQVVDDLIPGLIEYHSI